MSAALIGFLAGLGQALVLTLLVVVVVAFTLGAGLTGSALDRDWSRDPRVY